MPEGENHSVIQTVRSPVKRKGAFHWDIKNG